MTEAAAPASQSPVRRRRQVGGAVAPAGGTPAVATADTMATQDAPTSVSEPPELPEGLLDETTPEDDGEHAPTDGEGVSDELRQPPLFAKIAEEALTPATPPRRRGRPPRIVAQDAGAPIVMSAASTPAQPLPPAPPRRQPIKTAALEPSDEDLRALGRLTLMARQRGVPLETIIAEIRSMIVAYDKFGG